MLILRKKLKEILLRHFWHLICSTPFGGHSILKIGKNSPEKYAMDQMFSITFAEANLQRHQYFMRFFFPKYERFLGWSDACFSSSRQEVPPSPQLWVIILWTWWWEKSDFPSLHCNLDLGIIHPPPSPNSSHKRVSLSKVSHNRGICSISGNKNIIYVSA